MLAFVDESGDTGRKILNRSSLYFVVAVVIFRDSADAQACEYAIQRLRRNLNLPARYEFHYAENSFRVKEAFLQTASAHRFEYHAFAIDKSATDVALRTAFSEGLYKFASRRAFEIANPRLTRNMNVTIDERGGKQFRNEIARHLRHHVIDYAGNTLIGRLSMRRSNGDNLLQLADYVAGITNRVLRGQAQEVELRQRYLLSHEASREVWP